MSAENGPASSAGGGAAAGAVEMGGGKSVGGAVLVTVCALSVVESIAAKINPFFIFIVAAKVEILFGVLSMSAICRRAARPA